MAQLTLADGDYPTAAQLNTYALGEGGAWTSWTPTVTQSGSVTVTNTRSVYARWGRLIVFNVQLAVTGSGTGSNAVVISLPVTAASSFALTNGGGYIYDSSANIYYHGFTGFSSTTAFTLSASASSGASTALGSIGFTAGLASGDQIVAGGIFEAAS